MKGLILTYLITAVASIGALRRPLIGFYVYVGFAVLRPQAIFGWAGDMDRLSLTVGTAMLIGWAIHGFGSWKFGRGRAVLVALLLFVVWFVLSALFGLDPSRSVNEIVNVSKTVLPMLVGVTLMREPKHWRWLLWTIVLCMGYVGFEMNIDYLVKRYNTAAQGFGGMDNNFFGLALVTVLGPAVALAVASPTWPKRLLAAAAAAFILHTTLLTFSRGAMVGLLALGATAFVMMPKRPKHLTALILTAAVAVWLTGPELAYRYQSTFVSAEERDGSSQSRVDLWRDALQVVAQYPLFGVGPRNWRTIASQYGWPEGKSAHSVWMETAAENGIPGTLFLMLFFGIAAKRLWPIARGRTTSTDPYAQALAGGGVLAIVGFCVTGQFVSAPDLEVPYYIVTAAIVMLKLQSLEAVVPAAAAVVGTSVASSPTARRPALPATRKLPTPTRSARVLRGPASSPTGRSN